MSGKQYYNNNNNDRRENRGYYSKRHRGSNFKKHYKGRPPIKFDDHGDIDMGGHHDNTHQQKRFNPYGQSSSARFVKGRKGGKTGRFLKSMDGGPRNKAHNWAKVTIPFGKKVEKAFLLRTLTGLADQPFVPINYHNEGNTVIFYVEDIKTGLALDRYSMQISTSEGFKLKIITQPSAPPIMHLDKEIIQKIKVCMSNRFDPSTGRLNLSKFHTDSGLKAQGVYAPLHRYQVLSSVVQIIQDNIPEMKGLDLSSNKLSSLCALGPLFRKSQHIVELNMSDNVLRSVADLDKIENSHLTTLNLDRNPLCDAFKDQSTYISTVRRRFPKVVNLDGQTLPPPIGFEIEKDIKLPSTQGNFFPNEDCKSIVLTFLDQYYNIYDSTDRQSLLQAYSDNSMMSMSINRPKAGPLLDYQKESRNLLRVSDSERRKKLLHQGRLSVVSFLCELLRTQHDRNSFIIDVNFVSPQMISFTVCGLYKEFEKEVDIPQKSPIRSFNRTFVVVPQGSGISIINETLVISNPSSEQIRTAFKGPAPTPSPSPVPTVSSVQPVAPALDPQQQMIASFAEKSGMNAEFSAKCLAENEWNFDKAAHTFMELKKRGVIPPQAFIK